MVIILRKIYFEGKNTLLFSSLGLFIENLREGYGIIKHRLALNLIGGKLPINPPIREESKDF